MRLTGRARGPCGEIGRRARLKIEFRKECWFESGQGHQLFSSIRAVGMVFQQFNLFPHRTALDVMTALAGEGRTMVCVTHEMGFAREAGDRIRACTGFSRKDIGALSSLMGAAPNCVARLPWHFIRTPRQASARSLRKRPRSRKIISKLVRGGAFGCVLITRLTPKISAITN